MSQFNVIRFGLLLAVVAIAGLDADVRADGPFQFHTLTPCRIADTRDPDGDRGGPILQDQVVRKFPVQGVCGVPVGAKAVTVNLTAVTPNGGGFLTLYPSDIATPLVASLNFSQGEVVVGNGAIVPLADQISEPLDLAVYPRVAPPSGLGEVHVVIDVTGYFE